MQNTTGYVSEVRAMYLPVLRNKSVLHSRRKELYRRSILLHRNVQPVGVGESVCGIDYPLRLSIVRFMDVWSTRRAVACRYRRRTTDSEDVV